MAEFFSESRCFVERFYCKLLEVALPPYKLCSKNTTAQKRGIIGGLQNGSALNQEGQLRRSPPNQENFKSEEISLATHISKIEQRAMVYEWTSCPRRKCNLAKYENGTRKVFLIVDTRKYLICSQAGMLFSFESWWPIWATNKFSVAWKKFRRPKTKKS